MAYIIGAKIRTVITIPIMIPSTSKSPSLRKNNSCLFDELGMTIIVTAKKGQPEPPFLKLLPSEFNEL